MTELLILLIIVSSSSLAVVGLVACFIIQVIRSNGKPSSKNGG